MIETREEYDYVVSRGFEPLVDKRFPMEIGLRREVQGEMFGKNDSKGNEKFYKWCLRKFPHVCEECGVPIENPWAMNVSHILTRGAHPDKAHDPRNVNILCWRHHMEWENGNRKSMRIYSKNEKTIEQLKREYQ